jgi:hypothetical protein
MKNIKEFCKKHKKEIIFTGCIVGAVVIGVLTKEKRPTKKLIDVTGMNYITWKPKGYSITLEEIKEVLDLNANNPTAKFAVIKDSATKYGYIGILLNDNVIMSK